MCNNRADENGSEIELYETRSSFAQIKLVIRNWFEKRTIWQLKKNF